MLWSACENFISLEPLSNLTEKFLAQGEYDLHRSVFASLRLLLPDLALRELQIRENTLRLTLEEPAQRNDLIFCTENLLRDLNDCLAKQGFQRRFASLIWA